MDQAKKQPVSPPVIAYSHFIPPTMVEHLMRAKKDSALGGKWEDWKKGDDRQPDSITHMEAALHTFVTPVVGQGVMHGIHVFADGHRVKPFGPSPEGDQLAMPCIISAMIHQDYEYDVVMPVLFSLEEQPIEGKSAKFPNIISTAVKQDEQKRHQYDALLKKAAVRFLCKSHRLPALSDVLRPKSKDASTGYELFKDVTAAAKHLEDLIVHTPKSITFADKYIKHRGKIISMEMMMNTAAHQVYNEFAAIEKACPPGVDWMYTFNPPRIFAKWWDPKGKGSSGTEFMSIVWVAAFLMIRLKRGGDVKIFDRCHAIAWDDYATPGIVGLLEAVEEAHPGLWPIHVYNLDQIYDRSSPKAKPKAPEEIPGRGFKNLLFKIPKTSRGPEPGENAGYLLVIHNNSDAFGQNIETECGAGSLDGAIGTYSNAAACLARGKRDLLTNLVECDWEVTSE